MSRDGVSTRLQKDVGCLQQAVAKLHEDVSQWSSKLNDGLKELKMEFKRELKLELRDLKDWLWGEIKSEMLSLLELYLGRLSASVAGGQSSVPVPARQSSDKGKGILGVLPTEFL
ncbi:hypothetical protein V6Z11_D10G080900 [Gossypium hirsutum]